MIVTLTDVGVCYPRSGWVLRHFTFNIAEGDRVAIVGPSGSGKSTVLNVIAGGLAPTEGTVTRRCPRGVRVVNQTNAVLGRRTVADNVKVSVIAAHRSGIDVDVDDALESVGLGERARAPAATLSGGESQRLCIARSLICAPTLVVADEPTGQLDARSTDRVTSHLLAAPRNTAVVVATHDPNVAARFDRVVDLGP